VDESCGSGSTATIRQRQAATLSAVEMFRMITDVFRQSGRSVPVINDKHLCGAGGRPCDVAISRELKFPMLAGSSAPWPGACPGRRALREPQRAAVASRTRLDIYGFHVLDALQSMGTRRRQTG